MSNKVDFHAVRPFGPTILQGKLPLELIKVLDDRATELLDNEKLSKKYDLKLIPFLLEGVAFNPALNLSDGMHPNREGTIVISETLKKSILSYIN